MNLILVIILVAKFLPDEVVLDLFDSDRDGTTTKIATLRANKQQVTAVWKIGWVDEKKFVDCLLIPSAVEPSKCPDHVTADPFLERHSIDDKIEIAATRPPIVGRPFFPKQLEF